jgi:lysophospholipid acyltransferase (LPLAT)-like uncharacterized protein
MIVKAKKRFSGWCVNLSVSMIAWLAYWILRGLFLTLRPIHIQRNFACSIHNRAQPALLAIWHGRLLYFIYLYRHLKGTVLVSQSKDGELISQILAHFGVHATRGSSSRGGTQALLQMIKRIQDGYYGAFTPDGPRGPRHRVKAGIISAAQKTGAPILPVVYNAKWKRVLPSWDRFILPLPFSRIVVVYGEPVYVPATASSAAFAAKQKEIETSLQRITQIADNFFNH